MSEPSLYGAEPDPLKAHKKPPNPINQAFGRWWAEAWKDARGATFVWSAKERGNVDKVRAASGDDLEEMKRRAVSMLHSDDEWLAQNASPSMLLSKWNNLAALPAEQELAAPKDPVDGLLAWMVGAYNCRVTPEMRSAWAFELRGFSGEELLEAARIVMRSERSRRSTPNLEEMVRALKRTELRARRDEMSHEFPPELVAQVERERAARRPPSESDDLFMELATVALSMHGDDFGQGAWLFLLGVFYQIDSLHELRAWWHTNLGALPERTVPEDGRLRELIDQLKLTSRKAG